MKADYTTVTNTTITKLLHHVQIKKASGFAIIIFGIKKD